MTKEELLRRLEFLGIDGAETHRLRALRPLFARASEGLVSDFYRHLLSFPETRHLLRDGARRERLFGKQREYLLSLTDAPLDDEYVEGRRRIGEFHEEVGLPPGFFLGAYARYFSLLSLLIEEQAADMEQFRLLLVALLRRLLFDAQLSIDAYVERHEQRLQYLNEELAQMLRDVDR